MKAGIHPQVHESSKATCSSCGTVFAIPSTIEEVSVETCSQCHPIYTGKQQRELKGGRVERFQKRMAKSQEKKKN